MLRAVRNTVPRRFALALLLLLGTFGFARAQTLVASDLHARLTLGFKVADAPLQRRLPAGWQLDPPSAGPSKGANLMLGFVDRLLNLDPSGKPIGAGRDRYLAVAVPARQADGGQSGSFVIRIYSANARLLPGVYRTSVAAEVSRTHEDRGDGVDPGFVAENWDVRDGAGGRLHLDIRYRRGPLTRSTTDARFYSPVQPAFFRIYRMQQAFDVLRSSALEVDRVESVEFTVTLSDLADLLDGTQQLLSIVDAPMIQRDVFLPK